MSGSLASVAPGAEPLAPQTQRVALGERSYDIVVGAGLIDEAGPRLRPLLARPQVVVITDANVGPLYLDRLTASLAKAGIRATTLTLPAGEPTKDFVHLSGLCESVLAAGIDRGTTLFALGGGVIGDIVGFAAGILLRGLNFVQVPTTLLAQVDSAVGGKTGINTPQGKNLVGLFHQPRLVLADTASLDSLDARQLRAGYAEVVKYGVLGDAGFFSWLERHGRDVLAGDPAARRHAVLTCCAAKAAIVAADEREAGQRALLNLGHTFGHALEAETGFGNTLLHGEAVAIGMVLALGFSARLGLCPASERERLRDHLAAAGLPTRLSDVPVARLDPRALVDHMTRDKKADQGRLVFILARRIGEAVVQLDVPAAEVFAFLTDCLND